MQYLVHLHPSILKEWAQEMKDAAERIFNKSVNSKAEKIQAECLYLKGEKAIKNMSSL